jgi:hypothetical protein
MKGCKVKIRANTTYSNWTCRESGEPYTPTDGALGFVYKITDSAGVGYVGKKSLSKDSGWRTYRSSCHDLRQKIIDSGEKRNDLFTFEVLWECFDEKTLKVLELIEMCKHDTFTHGYNSGISVRQIGKLNLEKAVRK